MSPWHIHLVVANQSEMKRNYWESYVRRFVFKLSHFCICWVFARFLVLHNLVIMDIDHCTGEEDDDYERETKA